MYQLGFSTYEVICSCWSYWFLLNSSESTWNAGSGHLADSDKGKQVGDCCRRNYSPFTCAALLLILHLLLNRCVINHFYTKDRSKLHTFFTKTKAPKSSQNWALRLLQTEAKRGCLLLWRCLHQAHPAHRARGSVWVLLHNCCAAINIQAFFFSFSFELTVQGLPI